LSCKSDNNAIITAIFAITVFGFKLSGSWISGNLSGVLAFLPVGGTGR